MIRDVKKLHGMLRLKCRSRLSSRPGEEGGGRQRSCTISSIFLSLLGVVIVTADHSIETGANETTVYSVPSLPTSEYV